LRDEIKNRKDYLAIKATFEFLKQTKAYCKDKSFIVRRGKNVVELHAHLNSITDPKFRFYYSEEKRTRDLEKIDERGKYLIYHNSIYSCSCPDFKVTYYRSKLTPHYSFRFPWMFEEITKPHYLTHYTPLDGELESRKKKIQQEIEQNDYYSLVCRSHRAKEKLWNDPWFNKKYNADIMEAYNIVNFE